MGRSTGGCVRIAGTAPTFARMDSPPPGVELWCSNRYLMVKARNLRVIKEDEWTRWFNLHSQAHMRSVYPETWSWFGRQTKPIVLQKAHGAIPASEAFPGQAIADFFGHRYFTCSGTWLIANAIFEDFSRIELPGFAIPKHKPRYMWERPCMFYWVEEARRRGIEVILDPIIEYDASEAGDPHAYTGPVYGYDTKPETPHIYIT